tara:strand:+ start:52905 stop:54341 length:1437 start_codon:yes stop_codon:yes gene_type:complete
MQLLRRHRRPVSGHALAEELGVSLRTLYRDIADLKAIGAQIDGEPGMGYVLEPGFMLPPLMFSAEEVEALALGLKWVQRRADSELAGAAAEALAKVSAVLPRELQHRLQDSALMVGPGWDKYQSVELKVLRQAIAEERKLQIEYRDRKGAASSRIIWPFALGFFESTRMLAAWCEMRGGFRQFRVDRLLTASPLSDRYPCRRQALHKAWMTELGAAELTAIEPANATSSNAGSLGCRHSEALLTESVSTPAYAVTTPASTPTNGSLENSMSTDLVFYTNPQSRGGIVHWMLEELGVPYQVEYLEYGTSMKSPEYLAVNPMGKVPAIRHGDVVVTEAAAICAYLAEAFPEANLKPDGAALGPYYRWLFFVAGPFEAAVGLRACNVDLNAEQEMELGCGRLEKVVDVLAEAVRGRQYIAGDHFSAADVYVGAHIGWGMLFGTLEKRPEFVEYWNGLQDRPANRRSEELAEKAMTKQAWTG